MELWLRNWEFSCFGGSQLFRSCEIGVTMLRNGTRVPKLVSQLRNTLPNGALAANLGIFTLCSFAAVLQLRNEGSCAAKWHSCAKLGFAEESIELRNDFAKDGRFCRDTLIPQWLLLGCETVSQQSANFAEPTKSRRPLFLPYFCSIFAPKDFLSISLQFLLILIIQKPILHQNNQNLSIEIKIKAFKSKLKQVKKQNKKIWTS